MPETKLHAFAVSDCCTIQAISAVDSVSEDGVSRGRLLRFLSRPSREFLLFSDPSTRRALVEMHSVFAHTQQLASTAKLGSAQAMSLSRQYHSVLRRVFGLDEQTTVWSLVEALFLNLATNPPVFDLCTWAMQSFEHVEKATVALLEEHRRSRRPLPALEEYWRVVALAVSGCRFSDAASLLAEGADAASSSLAASLRLFSLDWLAQQESIVKLEKWQAKMKESIDGGIFLANPNVNFIAKLLIGEKAMVRQLAETVLSEWWQLVPLLTLSLFPRAGVAQLSTIAQEAASLFSPSSDGRSDIFSAIFSMDALSVLQELSPYPWMAVHLTDLLHHIQSGSDAADAFALRSFLLREYGTSMMAHSSLWKLGADYLAAAGEQGRACLENHLCRLYLRSERDARQALSLAEQLDLQTAASTIAASQSRRLLVGRQWLAALSWALRDLSGRSLEAAVSRVLASASEEEVALLSLLEHLPDAVQRTPSLALLFNFYRFLRAEKDGNRDGAVKILIRMVISADVPVFFRERLFVYLREVLSDGMSKLERAEVYELLSFVQAVSLDEDSSSSLLPDIRLRLLETLATSITNGPRFIPNNGHGTARLRR